MTVLIVNNDPEFYTGKLLRDFLDSVEKNSRDNVEVAPFTDISRYSHKIDNYNAVILSGSSKDSHSLAKESEKRSRPFQDEIGLIKTCRIPILAICFGHELVAHAFGSGIGQFDQYVRGFQNVEIIKRDKLFSDWKEGDVIVVQEYHTDYLTELPTGFICLARSKRCSVEAMRHTSRPIYTAQFHPERSLEQETGLTFPDGGRVLRNFFDNVCRIGAV